MLYSRLAPTGAVITIVPVAVLQSGCVAADAVGAAGPAGTGLTVTEPAIEIQPVVVFLTVTAYKPDATLLKVVEAWYVVPLILYSRLAPVGAVIKMVPVGTVQPGCTDTVAVGAAGNATGAAVTELLIILVHPPTVCVTVYVPAVVTVLGLPVPASLQVSVPVAPVAVMVELPQLFTTVNTGAAGTGNGAVFTELLTGLVQPPTVCVTV